MAAILPATEESVAATVEALVRGQLCVIPTDTVYGIAAIVAPEPVSRLYRAKGRPGTRPIPVLISDLEAVHRLAAVWPAEAEVLAHSFWPGALTMVVPAQEWIPVEITAGSQTVGIRWPSGGLVHSLIRRAGGMLAVTSANRSGQPPAVSAAQAQDTLGDAVSYVLDGGVLVGNMASTVVTLVGGQLEVLREGPIGWESLHAALAPRARSKSE